MAWHWERWERNVSKATMRLEMDARARRSCTKARRVWHTVGLGVNTARICDGRHGQPSGWVLNASNGENRARTSWPSNGRRKSYLGGVKDSYILTAHLTPHTIFHDESSRPHWKDLQTVCLCFYVIEIPCFISVSRIFFFEEWLSILLICKQQSFALMNCFFGYCRV